jgi:hypothetical protein
MKKYIDTIKKFLLWWIVFWLTALWVAYAANIITSVTTQTINSWDTISQSWYQDVNDKLSAGWWIWVWQTRQVYTSPSRKPGVTYTNNTGKPIFISLGVNWWMTSGNGAYLYVNWVHISSKSNSANWWIYDPAPMTAIIPNGSTYKVTVYWTSIGPWAELR